MLEASTLEPLPFTPLQGNPACVFQLNSYLQFLTLKSITSSEVKEEFFDSLSEILQNYLFKSNVVRIISITELAVCFLVLCLSLEKFA